MSMAATEDKKWTASGVAMLCFDSPGASFQGRLVTAEGKQFGLMGKLCGPPPDSPFHQCCFDEDPIFFQITVINFKPKTEAVIHYVMKTNGDNCSLTSDDLDFVTDELLVDGKAETTIKEYFSKSLLGKNCIICVGQWNMRVVFPRPVKTESDHDDSDF